jgi:hypothetical protein
MFRIVMAAGLLLAATTVSVSAQAPGGGAPPHGAIQGPAATSPDHNPPPPRLVCIAGPRTCPGPAHGQPGDRCSCQSQGGHRVPGHLVPQPGPRH